MALIKCPECGKDMSENAKACPNCGNPNTLTKEQKANKVLKRKNNNFLMFGVVSIIFCIFTILSRFSFENNNYKVYGILSIICAIIPILLVKKEIPTKVFLLLIMLIDLWFFMS